MRPVLGLPFVLGAVLAAAACQNQSSTSFDDSDVPASTGGQTNGGSTMGGSSSGGTKSDAGSSTQGGDAASGGGGAAGMGGKGMGGAGGKGMAGAGGKGMSGGGGMPEGGTMVGGSAGVSGGGNAQGGSAGTGGTSNPPEPVTIEITSIVDSTVSSCDMNQNFGSEKLLRVDVENFCVYASLLQPALDAIPAGATVTNATLSLNCTETSDPMTVSYATAKWTESMVRWNNRPGVGSAIGTLTCTQAGMTTVDITAAVVAWLSGAKEPNGVYVGTSSMDGAYFDSTEADNMADRPSLSVTYTPAQ